MEREVTLMEILDARDRRAQRQRELLGQYALPLVSFTLNIAGPMKNGTLIRRAFREGTERLEDVLRGEGTTIAAQEHIDEPTGCEGFFVLRGNGERIKRLCIALEDEDALGRLFDLDVIDPVHGKWDRTALGFSKRGCLVCGRLGKDCASRRAHSAAELQEKTAAILHGYFAEKDAQWLAGQAARALPGLYLPLELEPLAHGHAAVDGIAPGQLQGALFGGGIGGSLTQHLPAGLHLPAQLSRLFFLPLHLLPLAVQLREHILKADILCVDPGCGLIDDALR